MNTGRDGSLATIHANSARDAVTRIETMVAMAGLNLPVHMLRHYVASALDVISASEPALGRNPKAYECAGGRRYGTRRCCAAGDFSLRADRARRIQAREGTVSRRRRASALS